jgi:predicted cation transporter
LVAAFLAGLIVLGKPQKWWLEPLLLPMPPDDLFLGATLLTAITDNAALTFLGAQVPSLAELSKLALVSGAVVGGGLTVVANAPNPAGYGILNPTFDGGIRPSRLLWAAIPPTIIAAICFWFI